MALAQPASSPSPVETPPSPVSAPVPEPVVVPSDPAVALREANAAATSGDWNRVEAYVRPLLSKQLERADLAEAHRLAGIAALLVVPPARDRAEQHFLAYLKLDLDAHLDPALYPPEVVNFFNDVRARHAAELRTLRPKRSRYAVLTLVPPFGQFQNGERTKGWIIAGLLGAFAATNVTTYLVLRSWCFKQSGPGGSSVGCDETTNRDGTANTLRALNITAGVGLIITYAYGVYDAVSGYRRETRERAVVPYATTASGGGSLGVRVMF
jgi:hypothetical protein